MESRDRDFPEEGSSHPGNKNSADCTTHEKGGCPRTERNFWYTAEKLHLHIIALPFAALQCLALSGLCPHGWKRARVIALRKPDKATYSVAKSYRPISLLSILGKSLESIVSARIVRVLEKGGLFSPF